MNEQLKHRVIGAGVLVLLAVVFIPILLPGPPEDESARGPDGLGERSPPVNPAFSSSVVPLERRTADVSPGKERPLASTSAVSRSHTEVRPAAGSATPSRLERRGPGRPSAGGPNAADEPETAVRTDEAGATPPRPAYRPGPDSSQSPSSPPQPTRSASPTKRAAKPAQEKLAPAAKASDGPHGWAVQVGSFTNPHNALGLRDRLKAQGFTAFVAYASAGGARITRVLVGPVRQRKAADSIRSRLRTATDLRGILVQYPPAKTPG